MNTTPDLERIFPLSGGSAPRPQLRPPRLASLVSPNSGVALGHHAFLRAWAGSRGRASVLAPVRTTTATPS